MEIRVSYIDRRGAHCMRTVRPDELGQVIRRLYRRGLLAAAHEYNDGRRDDDRHVGGVQEQDGRLVWWYENVTEQAAAGGPGAR